MTQTTIPIVIESLSTNVTQSVIDCASVYIPEITNRFAMLSLVGLYFVWQQSLFLLRKYQMSYEDGNWKTFLLENWFEYVMIMVYITFILFTLKDLHGWYTQ